MSTAEKRFISSDEYLTIERASEFRHEYYNGEMFAMSGATRAHNVIAGNIFRRFLDQFENRDCEAYMADMRVKVDRKGLYTYPDVVTACAPGFEDDELDTLINPRVIVEVLSKSTEGYDRGTKFEMYRRLPSLQDYVLVSQDKMHVEHFQRQPDGRWILEEFDSPERTLAFETSNCILNVADVYTKVSFDTES
ncbi:MAG: Uma2 family endonuclease [Planctomycetota bacterium]|nr:Uma2 family endonuclease [Planctomycetota bacterium]